MKCWCRSGESTEAALTPSTSTRTASAAHPHPAKYPGVCTAAATAAGRSSTSVVSPPATMLASPTLAKPCFNGHFDEAITGNTYFCFLHA